MKTAAKAHRQRGALRWMARVALVGAGACAVLFAIGLRKTVIVGLSGYGLMLTNGGVWLMHRPDFSRREWATTDATGRVDWWPPCGLTHTPTFTGSNWSVDARLWFLGAVQLAGAGAIVGGGHVRAHGRRRAGRCVGCGFDLRATLPSQPCPECGRGV